MRLLDGPCVLFFFMSCSQDAEKLQVVQYEKGGHYHTHHDSTAYTPRYLTLLYFLTDVDFGGETAFPLADITDPPEIEWDRQSGTPDGWDSITKSPQDR